MGRNLSVPDSPESAIVSQNNISGLREAPASAVSITMTGKPPGEVSHRNSYVPSQAKARSIAEARGEVPRSRRSVVDEPIRKIHGVDYMSAKDTVRKLRVVDSEILSLAKEIWGEEKDVRRRYKKAKQMVDDASEEDLEDPDGRLSKAIRIVEKGTLSKRSAKKEARSRLDNQKRSHM